MKIKVSDLKQGVKKNFSFQEKLVSFSRGPDNVEFTDFVKVDIEVIINNHEIMLSGKVIAPVKLTCNRCLEPYNTQLSFSLNESFLKEEYLKRLSIEEMDDNLHSYKGDFIELDDIIIQNIILLLPPKIICSEDCKGLCPQCGINLNESQCDCDTTVIDPRLAKLKELFKKN